MYLDAKNIIDAYLTKEIRHCDLRVTERISHYKSENNTKVGRRPPHHYETGSSNILVTNQHQWVPDGIYFFAGRYYLYMHCERYAGYLIYETDNHVL